MDTSFHTRLLSGTERSRHWWRSLATGMGGGGGKGTGGGPQPHPVGHLYVPGAWALPLCHDSTDTGEVGHLPSPTSSYVGDHCTLETGSARSELDYFGFIKECPKASLMNN